MTKKSKIVIVEGGDDITFYDRVLRLANGEGTFALYSVEDIKDVSIGKRGVIQVYDAVVGGNLNQAKLKKFLICLDKDIDDFRNVQISSPNVIYSWGYSIENDLIRSVDLSACLGAAMNLPASSISSVIGDVAAFLDGLSSMWQEWTCFCFFNQKRLTTGRAEGYSKTPPLNMADGRCDVAIIQHKKEALRLNVKWTPLGFRREYAKCERVAADLFANRLSDLIFNGKWYISLIENWLQRLDVFSNNLKAGFALRFSQLMVMNLTSSMPLVGKYRFA